MLAFVKTYGCQQNVSDSEKIKNILIKLGFNLTEKKEEADIIIFNTCAVRENAELRVFGNLGQLKNLKKKNPNLIIAVCGCMTEQDHIAKKIKSIFSYVEIIFGTNSINLLPKFIEKVIKTRKQKSLLKIKNFEKKDLFLKNSDEYRDDLIKAFVPIMQGCDNFCSYCIVPFVRGKEKSRKPSDIYKEIYNLIKNGYKDITLLGQNVNSYGKGLEENINFTDLLKMITKIQGEYWIRFMTSHPKDISCELIDEIASNDKIAKHIHLPVQSGSNDILGKMNRKYTKEDYLEFIKRIKSKIHNVSITSDIIIGFPGETHKDFKETFNLVKKVGYSSLFTFIYSKRKGTKAANMEDNVTYEKKVERLSSLINLQRQKSIEYNSRFLNKKIKVLVKEKDKESSDFWCIGNENLKIKLRGENIKIGEFINVRITSFKEKILIAKICNKIISK